MIESFGIILQWPKYTEQLTLLMKFIQTDKPFFIFSLEADRDYILSRLINFSGSGFSSRAGYFGQQAIEKYLKALMVYKEKYYSKSHDLISLAKHCSKYNETFSDVDFLEKVTLFNDFIEIGRYGAESNIDPHSKKEKEFTTAGVYTWIDTNIFILDEVVNAIRNELPLDESNDTLIAIINGNEENFIASTWKLPIKLKDILATKNKYFS